MQMENTLRVLAFLAVAGDLVLATSLKAQSFRAVQTEVAKQQGYGPAACVTVQKSQAGSCVLKTHCKDDDDLEKVEFAFLCVMKSGEVQKHSYGDGGFGSDEEFDTSVACEDCLVPTVALSLQKAKPKKKAKKADEEADDKEEKEEKEDKAEDKEDKEDTEEKDEKKDAPAKPKGLPVDLSSKALPKGAGKSEASREAYLKDLVATHADPHKKDEDGKLIATSTFGPGNCVSTYLSPQHTCMMKTMCKDKEEDLKTFDFGLTCVEESGKSTRHLFGTNSFHAEEKFDTLIDCKLCLGLDASKIEEKQGLAAAVGKLKKEIDDIKKGMEDMTADVKKLNTKVFPKKDDKKDDKKEDKKAADKKAADEQKVEELKKQQVKLGAQIKKIEDGKSLVMHKRKSTSYKAAKKAQKEEDEESDDEEEEVADDEEDDDEEEAPAPVVHRSHHQKSRHHKEAKKKQHKKAAKMAQQKKHTEEEDSAPVEAPVVEQESTSDDEDEW